MRRRVKNELINKRAIFFVSVFVETNILMIKTTIKSSKFYPISLLCAFNQRKNFAFLLFRISSSNEIELIEGVLNGAAI